MTLDLKTRELLDSLPDGVLILDEDLAIVDANGACRGILGREPVDLLGRHISEFIKDLQEDFDEDAFGCVGLEDLIGQGNVDGREVTFMTGSGKPIPVALSASRVKDRPLVICTARDLSAMKRVLEVVASERERAVYLSKMAALGEMAASIGHEIKNPLMIIHGFNEQLSHIGKGQGDVDIEKIRTVYRKIRGAIDRMTKIVQGMQGISRAADSDAMDEVRIDTIVEETLAYCQYQFAQGSITLHREIDPQATIYAHEVQISQLILNLLNNAVQALQGVKDPWVAIRVKKSGTEVRLEVANNGPRIADTVQARLLSQHFSTKRKGEGTGLGLSICRSIVHHHEGRIEIASDETETSFIVHLPKSGPAAAA